MLGWRKLSAWFLVFALVAAAMVLKRDVPPEASKLLTWVTNGFFMANAAKPTAQVLIDKIKKKDTEPEKAAA